MAHRSTTITHWQAGTAMPWQVLADGATTDGRFLVGEARIEPGAPCPSLHVHTLEHESIYVIDGVLTVEIGGDRVELGSGDCVVMPRGVPHRFGNLGDVLVRAIGTISPTAIEGMFAEEAVYFASLQGPPDPARMAEIVGRYGVTMLGGPLTRES
jgi:mannose-6-phosphate isomerase-like protein (cupin superfamily)